MSLGTFAEEPLRTISFVSVGSCNHGLSPLFSGASETTSKTMNETSSQTSFPEIVAPPILRNTLLDMRMN